jgi:hypothetical protein
LIRVQLFTVFSTLGLEREEEAPGEEAQGQGKEGGRGWHGNQRPLLSMPTQSNAWPQEKKQKQKPPVAIVLGPRELLQAVISSLSSTDAIIKESFLSLDEFMRRYETEPETLFPLWWKAITNGSGSAEAFFKMHYYKLADQGLLHNIGKDQLLRAFGLEDEVAAAKALRPSTLPPRPVLESVQLVDSRSHGDFTVIGGDRTLSPVADYRRAITWLTENPTDAIANMMRWMQDWQQDPSLEHIQKVCVW